MGGLKKKKPLDEAEKNDKTSRGEEEGKEDNLKTIGSDPGPHEGLEKYSN